MEQGDIRKFIIEEKDQQLVLLEVNSDITHEARGVNDFCRFCSKDLRHKGVLTHSALIFAKKKPPQKSVWNILAGLGLKLKSGNKKRSTRICQCCTRIIVNLEQYVAVFRKWKEAEEREDEAAGEDETVSNKTSTRTSPKLSSDEADPTSDKRDRSPSPSGPRQKRRRMYPPKERRSVTQVLTTYPSRNTEVKIAHSREAGIIYNIVNQNWKTAANLLSHHERLFRELKSNVLASLHAQCRSLTKPNNGFMLWKTSPDELKSFSFDNLIVDLERLAPFLLPVFNTVSNNNKDAACAALCIALRGREPRMSAFAHHLNSIIAQGGIKKAVFNQLGKMSITTTERPAREKLKQPTSKETDPEVEPSSELLLNSQNEMDASSADSDGCQSGDTDLDKLSAPTLDQELPS